MISQIVAKRYAKALSEIGREDGNFEQYGQELAQAAELFQTAPELESTLANPAFDLESRSKLLTTFLDKLGLSPMVKNFFRLLLDRGRISATGDISQVYATMLDELRGITRAQVTSAAPLNDQEVSGIAEALRKVAGQEVQVEVTEDPSLIGGVVARIGDLVLDGSVRTQLESMKDSLRRGEYT
ncbi:MAG: ATP synthase F1 subunit delta [Desulfarculaceae bacterium]